MGRGGEDLKKVEKHLFVRLNRFQSGYLSPRISCTLIFTSHTRLLSIYPLLILSNPQDRPTHARFKIWWPTWNNLSFNIIPLALFYPASPSVTISYHFRCFFTPPSASSRPWLIYTTTVDGASRSVFSWIPDQCMLQMGASLGKSPNTTSDSILPHGFFQHSVCWTFTFYHLRSVSEKKNNSLGTFCAV